MCFHKIMVTQQRHAGLQYWSKAHKAGHLKQYLRSDMLGITSQQQLRSPRAPAAPKAVINYINGGPSDENGTIIFPPVDPTRTLQPHRDALILSLGIGDFDVRRILVDPGSSPILCKHRSLATWDTVSQAKTLDESYPDSTDHQLHPWETLYCRSKRPSHSQRTILVVQDYHPSNHLGAHMATLHESHPLYISSNGEFLTNDGQIDLYGSQLPLANAIR
ncbi:hypothetical protein CK203_104608 [Vitis vinifera]|uniref:Uncharacterized protein n=1 Tax=Vitis vinifera TaxID=29760 RepID=A0A438CAS1_VITVI|nr:hypothetical protein CK203_104608 [Vitis vinifera]